jgi:Concanavalin A-like lectin/glucanases superfamily
VRGVKEGPRRSQRTLGRASEPWILCAVLLAGCEDAVTLELGAQPSDASVPPITQMLPPSTPTGHGLDAGLAVPTPTDATNVLLTPALRYTFAGLGKQVQDEVGHANGQVMGGAVLDGGGSLTLDGVDDFVDLPNRLISPLHSATFVAWVEWYGGICWQRIFDFGNTDAGEDIPADAVSSLFLTPYGCGPDALLAIAEFGDRSYQAQADDKLPSQRLMQVALVVDEGTGLLALYRDGARVAASSQSFRLAEIDDSNNWLGRSQWVQDGYAHLRYDEFRIYSRALTDAELAGLYTRGPDQL